MLDDYNSILATLNSVATDTDKDNSLMDLKVALAGHKTVSIELTESAEGSATHFDLTLTLNGNSINVRMGTNYSRYNVRKGHIKVNGAVMYYTWKSGVAVMPLAPEYEAVVTDIVNAVIEAC